MGYGFRFLLTHWAHVTNIHPSLTKIQPGWEAIHASSPSKDLDFC